MSETGILIIESAVKVDVPPKMVSKTNSVESFCACKTPIRRNKTKKSENFILKKRIHLKDIAIMNVQVSLSLIFY
jgi:hypothetical protein